MAMAEFIGGVALNMKLDQMLKQYCFNTELFCNVSRDKIRSGFQAGKIRVIKSWHLVLYV